MLIKLEAFWNSLPHQVRALIVLFLGAAGGVLKHSLSNPDACWSGPCLKGFIVAAIHAGGTAVLALYLPSGLGKSNA